MSTLLTSEPRAGGADRATLGQDLEASAKAYFDEASLGRRDVPRMYLKTITILAWFVLSWVVLVFFARGAWQGILAAVSLGLSVAAVGMNVQHDANHRAFSSHNWVNRVFGATLDMMGVSSFIWRTKHNVGHHGFTNVEGVDFDLDFGSLARLSPGQPHRGWHRYQHFYLWMFYGFLLPKWVFHDDFVILRRRLIGVHKLPPPGAAGIASFVIWKIVFVGWAIVIPAYFHPLWQVFLFHLLACFALGMTLGTVFQLAHCTNTAEFPLPLLRGEPPSRENEFAARQLATTVDFAPKSRVVTWFVGGLNYQVEHHLFPKVCHLHYPALSGIVATVAARHGHRRRAHETLGAALVAHFEHLRTMARPPVAVIRVPRAPGEPTVAETAT